MSGQARVTDYIVPVEKWRRDDEKQVSLAQSVINLIAKDLLPVSFVESLALRELMTKAQPRYTIPSRKHLCTKLLPEKFANLRDNIKKNLQAQAAPSTYITLDLWSSRDMRSFMGITCNFISNFT